LCNKLTRLVLLTQKDGAHVTQPTPPLLAFPNNNRFAPDARPKTATDANFCYSCANLYVYRGVNQKGALEVLVATGTANRLSCTCPANTFFQSTGSGTWACIACPTGSTSGAAGSSGFASCQAACRVGYWGEPGSVSYGYQCTSCPAIIGGNGGLSSTTGVNAVPAGGKISRDSVCTTCVNSATKAAGTGSIAAACDNCPTGVWSSGNTCSVCALGYKGSGASCTLCDSAFTPNTAWAPQPIASATNCGRC